MKNKLDKKFFDTHRVPELSAANIFYFSVNAALPDLFQQFDKLAKVKGRTVPDNSDERNMIASMNELAKAMGYKGISAKLSSTIEKMLEIGALEKVVVGAYVKLHIPGDI